jgi:pyruvate/2-oxoacid:ferredoxin oxidoreductase beta subunit
MLDFRTLQMEIINELTYNNLFCMIVAGTSIIFVITIFYLIYVNYHNSKKTLEDRDKAIDSLTSVINQKDEDITRLLNEIDKKDKEIEIMFLRNEKVLEKNQEISILYSKEKQKNKNYKKEINERTDKYMR